MLDKKNKKVDDSYSIDESQFDIDKSQYDTSEEPSKKEEPKMEETEVAPIDEKIETIHFPWFIAIVIGVLMVAIIGLIIAIKIIEG